MSDYAARKWGTLREYIHTGVWKSAKWHMYNIQQEGKTELFEQMVDYYKSCRDHAGATCVDEINIYAFIGKGKTTFRDDIELLLSQGVIWQCGGSSQDLFLGFIRRMKLTLSAQEWEDWCVGRDTLVIVPVSLSTREFEDLAWASDVLWGLIRKVRVRYATEEQIAQVREWMPYAEIVVEEP